MQAAVPAGAGARAALLGVEFDAAQEICTAAAADPVTGKTEIAEPANDNGGGQIVISGHKTAIDRALVIARERGVKRALLLPVSAPFHCALMAPAADVMAEALDAIAIAPPVVPIVANVTAAKVTDPAIIRDLLVRQVTGTVRWRESILAMQAMGVDSFLELGSGKVLAGLARRIAPDAAAASAGTPADIEALLKQL
jgi:[acyl-carrier-protein] S-malonyltransferase